MGPLFVLGGLILTFHSFESLFRMRFPCCWSVSLVNLFGPGSVAHERRVRDAIRRGNCLLASPRSVAFSVDSGPSICAPLLIQRSEKGSNRNGKQRSSIHHLASGTARGLISFSQQRRRRGGQIRLRDVPTCRPFLASFFTRPEPFIRASGPVAMALA